MATAGQFPQTESVSGSCPRSPGKCTVREVSKDELSLQARLLAEMDF